MKRNAHSLAADPIGFRPRTRAHDREIRRLAAAQDVSVTEWIHRRLFTPDEDRRLESLAFRETAKKNAPSNKSV